MAVAVNGLKMYLLLSKLSVMLSQVWHVGNEECVIQMEVSINIRVPALGPARARSILSVKAQVQTYNGSCRTICAKVKIEAVQFSGAYGHNLRAAAICLAPRCTATIHISTGKHVNLTTRYRIVASGP